MLRLVSLLPEFDVVMEMQDASRSLAEFDVVMEMQDASRSLGRSSWPKLVICTVSTTRAL